MKDMWIQKHFTEIKSQVGFTLLEVLIALAIMSVAFGAIIMLESRNMEAMERAERMNVVTMLAQNKMIEIESEFEGKKFDEISAEESGQFDSPYDEFRWTKTVEEVEFPNLLQTQDSDEGPDGGRVSSFQRSMGQLITKFLTDSIREVTLTIYWPKGTGEQSTDISTYWVDLENDFSLRP